MISVISVIEEKRAPKYAPRAVCVQHARLSLNLPAPCRSTCPPVAPLLACVPPKKFEPKKKGAPARGCYYAMCTDSVANATPQGFGSRAGVWRKARW